jgi:hypothetical protein
MKVSFVHLHSAVRVESVIVPCFVRLCWYKSCGTLMSPGVCSVKLPIYILPFKETSDQLLVIPFRSWRSSYHDESSMARLHFHLSSLISYLSRLTDSDPSVSRWRQGINASLLSPRTTTTA